MNQNKSFFIVTFVIILLLAVLAAGFYLSRQDNGQTSLRARKQQSHAVRNTDLEQLKTQEFLGALPSLEGPGSFALKSGAEDGALRPGAAHSADPFKRPDHKRFSQKPKHLQPGHGALPSAPTNMYEQAVQSVGENKAHQAAFAGRSGRAYPANTKGDFAPLASEDKTAHAAQTLLPYTASLPKKQREALEKQLNGLSGKVEEAILRAMLPKSKKDMNIEKYLSRNSQMAQEGTSSQNAGPFASVDRQLVRQKAGIVKSMKEAFGTKAANQAGKLMDGYRQEIMGMLNQTGLTAEQIKEQTRQISKKYNDQLQSLSEKSGKERLQNELEKRDSDLVEHFRQSYDEDVSAGLADLMRNYREEEMALAQRGLSQQEYMDQALALQRARDTEIRKYLSDNGQSLSPYINAPREQAQENPNQAPVAYRASKEEQAIYRKDAAERTRTLLTQAEKIYGKEGAEPIANVYKQYEQEVAKIWANPETTLQEKNQQQEELLKQTNAAVQRVQMQLNEDKQIAEIMQNPAFADVSPADKAAYERKARRVLHQMYIRANEIMENPNLSQAQKDAKIQELQQEAQRELSEF